MPNVTFYLMNEPIANQGLADEKSERFALACALTTMRFRQNQTLFLLAESQLDAEQLDELLWQQDPDSFVPHGLSEEQTVTQAPVEIGTTQPKRHRQVMINLTAGISPMANRFAQIIDFVPWNESEKQQARERYKRYRALGFTLETVPAPALP